MKFKLEIIEGDITTLNVDAIVNAANNSLMGGGGVDGAIHRAAGPALLEACRPLRGCETGNAKITEGFTLPANYIIHAVGPVWAGGHEGEAEALASCYRKSLELANLYEVTSIAFPSISTGAYRYPFDAASKLAIQTILDFEPQNQTINQVYLVAFGNKDFKNLQRIYKQHNASPKDPN